MSKDIVELLLQVYELYPDARQHCEQYISYEKLCEVQTEIKEKDKV